ncbi:unnamed protein product [Ectocarpus sp. CCAP 1310/34]|nr:unnamed protein product [Ectocarpus sp. CCAP 1310/34]
MSCFDGIFPRAVPQAPLALCFSCGRGCPMEPTSSSSCPNSGGEQVAPRG